MLICLLCGVWMIVLVRLMWVSVSCVCVVFMWVFRFFWVIWVEVRVFLVMWICVCDCSMVDCVDCVLVWNLLWLLSVISCWVVSFL